jgi:hypothetical protein
VREKRYIRHIFDIRSGADVGQCQLPNRAWPTLTSEKISLICFSRIITFLPSGENGEAAINALGTFTTVRMDFCHVAHTGTAARMPDEIGASIRRHFLDHFGLC